MKRISGGGRPAGLDALPKPAAEPPPSGGEKASGTTAFGEDALAIGKEAGAREASAQGASCTRPEGAMAALCEFWNGVAGYTGWTPTSSTGSGSGSTGGRPRRS